MINIMKSDLFRIFKGKAIYITTVIIVFMSLLSAITMQSGHIGFSTSSNIDLNNPEVVAEISNVKSLGEFRSVMKKMGPYPLDKQMIGENINLYYVFIIITVIVLVTDFSNGSAKNTLSSAITRKKYYFSKLILILGLSTVLIFFYNYLNYFLNLAINGKDYATPLVEFTKITISQLPILYGIISLLMCIAVNFRRTALFNTISIPLIFVTQLIIVGINTLFGIESKILVNYELQRALANLAGNPTGQYVFNCTLLGLGMLLIFNIIGYYSFRRAEIK